MIEGFHCNSSIDVFVTSNALWLCLLDQLLWLLQMIGRMAHWPPEIVDRLHRVWPNLEANWDCSFQTRGKNDLWRTTIICRLMGHCQFIATRDTDCTATAITCTLHHKVHSISRCAQPKYGKITNMNVFPDLCSRSDKHDATGFSAKKKRIESQFAIRRRISKKVFL